jgi:hypothetical protein
MQGVQESLAGRVAVLNLFGLSDEEKGPILPALNGPGNQWLSSQVLMPKSG